MIDLQRCWWRVRLALLCSLFLLMWLPVWGNTAWAATWRQSSPVSLTVVTAAVNLRSGPDKIYPTVGKAQRGEKLVILSQYNNCAWLQVRTNQNVEGWVTGKRQFVRLNGNCETLSGQTVALPPDATSPPVGSPTVTTAPSNPTVPPPTPLPTAIPTIASPTPTAAAPVSTVTDELAQKVPLEADKGCYLFQNFLGREILFTLTNQEISYKTELRIAGYSEEVRCLPPGEYSFTLSAAGYQSHNNVFHAYAGVRDYFQISGHNE